MSSTTDHKHPGLIGTIYDDNVVQNLSDESDGEIEYQPSRKARRVESDFNADFEFVAATAVHEDGTNVWNDLGKYVRRKAKTKTDDKINQVLTTIETQQDINNREEDIVLSDDELKHDKIRPKTTKSKVQKDVKDGFFEDLVEYDENCTFQQMNVSRPLLKAITQLNYLHTTPIQAATIPVALSGRDICGCAATGTGKTAAYMLPTLERLIYRPSDTVVTRVLVLVPTRELGVQVYQVTKQLSQYTDIQIALAVGGLDLKAQEKELRKRPDIVIATPGRLIDHLCSTVGFGLHSIEVLILDEADRMLDEYFADQMNEIIKQCAVTRQTMLFSATMTDKVKELAAVSLKNPMRIFVDSNREVAFNLRQEFVRLRNNRESDREAILCALVCRMFRERCIIFVQTKKQAHRLHILLGLFGISVAELHGNLTQPQRLDTLEKFKHKQADVLVATDVAARGLDIPDVKTVINFIMPTTLEHYIHRVGRTARAGRAGVSISIADENERKIVKEIIKRARSSVKSRTIATDIIDKYRNKVQELEPQIEAILKEELQEKLLSKAENQLNRSKKMLEGEKVDGNRTWFQSSQERKAKMKLLKEKHGKTSSSKKAKVDESLDKQTKSLAHPSRAARNAKSRVGIQNRKEKRKETKSKMPAIAPKKRSKKKSKFT